MNDEPVESRLDVDTQHLWDALYDAEGAYRYQRHLLAIDRTTNKKYAKAVEDLVAARTAVHAANP